MADLKEAYVGATVTLTTTALQSLTTSSDFVAGWGSAVITNLSDFFLDYFIDIDLVTASANRQVGSVNVYIIAAKNLSLAFPAVASGTLGTEGAISFTDAEERDAACKLVASFVVDTTNASRMQFNFYLTDCIKRCPPGFVIFISTNATSSGAALASSNNVVQVTGQYRTV